MTPRIHPRFPNYEVHADGRVFRISLRPLASKGNAGRLGEIKGRILKPSGYRQFKLVDADGFRVLIRANRLVAETFLGPAPSPQHQAAHKDGIRTNNAVSNLRWATCKENCADKEFHGTAYRGGSVVTAKFSDGQVAQIRAAFTGARGELARLAKAHGVGMSTIGRVVYGDSYKAAAPVPFSRRTRLTTAQADEIVAVYLTGGFSEAKKLANKYGASERSIAPLARWRGHTGNYRRGRGIVLAPEARA